MRAVRTRVYWGHFRGGQWNEKTTMRGENAARNFVHGGGNLEYAERAVHPL
jgi:hypothetical protein